MSLKCTCIQRKWQPTEWVVLLEAGLSGWCEWQHKTKNSSIFFVFFWKMQEKMLKMLERKKTMNKLCVIFGFYFLNKFLFEPRMEPLSVCEGYVLFLHRGCCFLDEMQKKFCMKSMSVELMEIIDHIFIILGFHYFEILCDYFLFFCYFFHRWWWWWSSKTSFKEYYCDDSGKKNITANYINKSKYK